MTSPIATNPDEPGSFLGTIAKWFVVVALAAGLFGLAREGDVQSAGATEGETETVSEISSGAFDSEGVDPHGPEAKNAKAFLKSYYDSLLDSRSRRSALNTMLTPEFRQTVNPAGVDAFWNAQQRVSVSEVIALSSTDYKATVTHLPFGSHAISQRMDFTLTCEVQAADATPCPPDALRIADALHLEHEH